MPSNLAASDTPWPGAMAQHGGNKVPRLVFMFWIIKILATTLGETGGDTLSMSAGLGYATSTLIFLAVLLALLVGQIGASRFYAALYWSVIVATTTAGTTLADFCDRSLGIGYAGGALLLAALVLVVLLAWRLSLGAIAAGRITSKPQEMFYWAAILSSNTLGTALGDWAADAGGLGYEGGALVFATLLAGVALAAILTEAPRTLLFWTAFVLTRPLGATLGDWLTKPHAHGGMAFSRPLSSALLAGVMVGLVALVRQAPEEDGE